MSDLRERITVLVENTIGCEAEYADTVTRLADAILAIFAEERAALRGYAVALDNCFIEARPNYATDGSSFHQQLIVIEAIKEFRSRAEAAEARIDELDKECTDRQLRIYALEDRVTKLEEEVINARAALAAAAPAEPKAEDLR